MNLKELLDSIDFEDTKSDLGKEIIIDCEHADYKIIVTQVKSDKKSITLKCKINNE